MKQLIIIVMWGILWGMEALGQDNQHLKHNIQQLIPNHNSQKNTTNQVFQQVKTYIEYLATKRQRFKSDRKFLKYIFFQTHRKHLKKYQMYQDFEEIFGSEKKYNCVSAATLYALILDSLGYKYTIRETAFHVYLVVHTKKYPKIMFDPTDANQGFLYNAYAVRKRERFYTENNKYKFNNQITLSQLIGLQYYNQGVHYFNQQVFGQAIVRLAKAYGYYPSDRVKALQKLAKSYYQSTITEK